MQPSRRLAETTTKTLTYAVLLVGSVGMALPFLWMCSTAFKAADKVMAYPPQWIPSPTVWKNFIEAHHELVQLPLEFLSVPH